MDNNSRKTVVVGISGGVDSAVAAYLMKEQGYDVIGVIMINDSTMDISDAEKVAKGLGIELVKVDMADDFRRDVIDDFVNEYICARTPNPCVRCNRYMKWAALEKVRAERGADLIATGHYARKVILDNGRYSLKRNNAGKDQTYALCMLTQEQLKHTVMPLSDYSKDEIRMIAQKAGIAVADKADSQDICFIPDNDYAGFIERYINDNVFGGENISAPGDFVDENGTVLGRHHGLIHYTIGQRKGLNLAMGRPVFVKALRPDTNEVVISTEGDVFGDTLTCRNINMIAADEPEIGKQLTARIRYADKGTSCRITECGKSPSAENHTGQVGESVGRSEDAIEGLEEDYDMVLTVEFDRPVRAITPGQSIVFYDGDVLYASGIII